MIDKNTQIIKELLQSKGTINVSKPLARSIGILEAITYCELLSRDLYFRGDNPQKKYLLDEDGYFYNTVEDLQGGTSLSDFQQRRAINKLKKLGLIEYKVKGQMPKRYFRISDNHNLIEILEESLKKKKLISNT